MSTYQEVIQIAKDSIKNSPNTHIREAIIDFGKCDVIYCDGLGGQRGVGLVFCFIGTKITYSANDVEIKDLEIRLTCGYVTPKGYLSTKKIPVTVADNQNLTDGEVIALAEFITDAKPNSFDPFYAEHEAQRRNASAWNYIAKNYITDPYCTR
jgi:hypothetical protein